MELSIIKNYSQKYFKYFKYLFERVSLLPKYFYIKYTLYCVGSVIIRSVHVNTLSGHVNVSSLTSDAMTLGAAVSCVIAMAIDCPRLS